MSYTPPGYPGQPQQPVSPDGRWWWDGEQWRPNAANPFGAAQDAIGNPHGPASPTEGIRFTPGPPGVPNPYVPPRLTDAEPEVPERRSVDVDVRFLLAAEPRRWWTPRRFVMVIAGVLLAIMLGIGLLFYLSIDAFQKQRGGDTDEHQAPAVTRQDETGMPS